MSRVYSPEDAQKSQMEKLDPSVLRRFVSREHNQGDKLLNALAGRWQTDYLSPQTQVDRLTKAKRFDLGSTNPYARAVWMRTIGAHLFHELGATSPDFRAHGPVYFVTVLDDSGQKTLSQFKGEPDPWHQWTRRSIPHFVARHRFTLAGFNHLGMIDIAPYVSSSRLFGMNRFAFAHYHGLIWGARKGDIEDLLEYRRRELRGAIPHSTPVKCDLINPSDLRQMLWYVCKTPRYQYQAWVKDNGRIAQFRGAINGVNSVRMHRLIGKVPLTELAVAGGRGKRVLQRVIDDLKSE